MTRVCNTSHHLSNLKGNVFTEGSVAVMLTIEVELMAMDLLWPKHSRRH